MQNEFIEYITKNHLFKRNEKVLLAVSGGIDSMVMTHLFISAGFETGIAHCNFQLRGSESDDDEKFVKSFAEKNNIKVHNQRFDTSGFAEERGISIQMAARELRYRWFEELGEKNGYSYIAVAHNLNDNVETFLINLSRGTGIAGLTGMKPKYKNIVRPLLFASRKAISDYCSLNNIKYREDRSNSETKYTRNKIRHKIIPLFKEINPSFETTIIETAERLEEINEIVSARFNEVRENVSVHMKDKTVFKISLLKELSPLNTLLFELFRPYGLGPEQLDDMINLFNSRTGSQLFTATHRIIKNRRELIAVKISEDISDSITITCIKDLQEFPGCTEAKILKTGKDFKIPESQNIGCFDAEKIAFPLIIRRWRHGDSFYPLGMKQKKKLSDYFTDRRYSIYDKECSLILETEGKIAWIINDRIDDRFKITSKTRKALIIRMNLKSD
jgi:tRNA(Ile)-lysidine synthase